MGFLKTTLSVLWVAALGSQAHAQTVPAQIALDAEQVYEISQDAIGGQVGNYVVQDLNGDPLALTELRGRPVVVSLIYTSCASICPVMTDHLADAVKEARKVLGPDSFSVLTFGFDASGDKPARMRAFSNLHGLDGLGEWYVASADADTTEAFLADLGFSWREAAGSFDHPSQTTILDAEGKVYRQLYGEEFPLPVFMVPLKELVLGRTTNSVAPADLWNRLTFLCTVYNPLTRAYRFDYGIFFGIFFGALSLIATGLVIFRLWLERRRALRKPRTPHRSSLAGRG